MRIIKKDSIHFNAIYLMLTFFFIGKIAIAQLSIAGAAINYAASSLAGTGVVISNATLTGNSDQIGDFGSGLGLIGIENGTALTTGKKDFAGTGNTSNVADYMMISPAPGVGSDVDLQSLAGTQNLMGPVILEFDVVGIGSLLEFEFVFATEEYPAYIGQGFNDVMGIFVSGPGISGSFSNNGENLALVPGTSTFISVNTVNSTTNSQYFVINWVQYNSSYYGPGTFAYNGFTIPITASIPIICGETYHVRLALSNVKDNKVDSGVFFKRGSMRSVFEIDPITASNLHVCDGATITLTTQGDNSWTYTWSDGQSGIGLTSITTIANLGTTQYSVTATNGQGCSISKTININVDPNANTAPYVNGVNNSGNYFSYVQAGDQICFNIPSFDDPDEVVLMTWNNGIQGASFSTSGFPHKEGVFCWTPGFLDIGMHTFVVFVEDDNACGSLDNSFTFIIKVVCEFCPIEVFYENRTSTNNPLPASTYAGHKITAGYSVDPNQQDGVVEAGWESPVEFRAPEIVLEAGFSAGQDFTATADLKTCIDECDECCDEWSGFTLDLPLPNIFTPNGDGINDDWYVNDINNPYCAFNAQGYELEIFDRWGSIVWSVSVSETSCCPFEAPSPNNPIDHSSIFWNGINQNGYMVSDGTYYYVLTLYGCGEEIQYNGDIMVIDARSSNKTSLIDNLGNESFRVPYSYLSSYGLKEGVFFGAEQKASIKVNEMIEFYPNPAFDFIFFKLEFSSGLIRILNSDGKLVVMQKIQNRDFKIDVSQLPVGTYLIHIESEVLENNFESIVIIK